MPALQLRHSAFTLVEVLIVVTLLVILGLAILIGLNPMAQIFKGYDSHRKADLYALKTAFEEYYLDHDCYPASDTLQKCGSNILDPYIKSIPCDPQDHTPYTLYIPPPATTCPQKFGIYTKLYSKTDAQANKYIDCPQTMAVASTNMTYGNIIGGCSNATICQVYYGCKSGVCTVIARDDRPACAPNYCDADCGGVDCTRKIRGIYVNECSAL